MGSDGSAGRRLRTAMLVARCGLLTLLARAALAVVPFGDLLRFVCRAAPAPGAWPAVERGNHGPVTSALEHLSRRVPGIATCLSVALVGLLLLRRRGVACELRIGVARRAKGGLRAHAWLESGGEVILGGRRSPVRYTALPAWPEPDSPR